MACQMIAPSTPSPVDVGGKVANGICHRMQRRSPYCSRATLSVTHQEGAWKSSTGVRHPLG